MRSRRIASGLYRPSRLTWKNEKASIIGSGKDPLRKWRVQLKGGREKTCHVDDDNNVYQEQIVRQTFPSSPACLRIISVFKKLYQLV